MRRIVLGRVRTQFQMRHSVKAKNVLLRDKAEVRSRGREYLEKPLNFRDNLQVELR